MTVHTDSGEPVQLCLEGVEPPTEPTPLPMDPYEEQLFEAALLREWALESGAYIDGTDGEIW